MTNKRHYSTANKLRAPIVSTRAAPWAGETATPRFTPPDGPPGMTPERLAEIKRIQKSCGPGLLSNIIEESITEVDRLRQRLATLEAAARTVCGAYRNEMMGSLSFAIEELGRVLGEEE